MKIIIATLLITISFISLSVSGSFPNPCKDRIQAYVKGIEVSDAGDVYITIDKSQSIDNHSSTNTTITLGAGTSVNFQCYLGNVNDPAKGTTIKSMIACLLSAKMSNDLMMFHLLPANASNCNVVDWFSYIQ